MTGKRLFSASIAIVVCNFIFLVPISDGWQDFGRSTVATNDVEGFFEVESPKAERFNNAGISEPLENLVWFSFDVDADGNKMSPSRSVDIRDTFAKQGLRLHCLHESGRVVSAGFRFKQSPSRGLCIGNFFLSRHGERQSYKGVMRIDFCDPENTESAATVTKIGFFSEIVKPDHLIVEAFNTSGHRIGISVSDRERTAFHAFESEVPIAWLEIRPNIYTKLERQSGDFAIDDLVIGNTEVDRARNLADQPTIIFRNGTVGTEDIETDLVNEKLEWFHAASDLPQIEFISSGLPVTRRDKELQNGVFAMLADASVVRCDLSNNGFRLAAASDIILPRKNIHGFWGANRTSMYPIVSDEKLSFPILVHPLRSIHLLGFDFDAANQTIAFELAAGFDAVKVADQFKVLGLTDLSRVPVSDTFPVWNRNPSQRSPNTGFVRTKAGEEFTFDGSSGFTLQSIGKTGVTIAVGETTFEIPIDQIQTIFRPKKD